MIRDSGNPPDLYAVRFPGAVAPHGLRAIRVLGATNVDWEDISEQDGRLYVTESDQSRRARYIYEIPEPDPLGPPRVHFSARYRYAYHPDDDHRREDIEAGLVEHMAQPNDRTDQLTRDQRRPAGLKRKPQTGEHERQRTGKQYLPNQHRTANAQ